MNKYTKRMFALIASLYMAAFPIITNAQDFTSSLHVPRGRIDVIRPKHRISYVGEYDSSVFTEIEDMTMT